MAQFGISATQMSGPDTKAAKFVRQPTADQSSNIALGSVLGAVAEGAKFAEGAYDRANVRQLSTGIEAIAAEGDVRQQEESLSALWEKTTEEELGKMSSEDFWKSADKVSEIQTSIDSTLQRLGAAHNQGRISADEYTARVNAVTRAAIARQPGLAPELVQQSAFYQKLSGITDQVEAARAFEKSQREDAQKAIEDENRILIKWGQNPNTIPPAQRGAVVQAAFKQEENVQRLSAVKQQMEALKAQGELKERVTDTVFTSPEHVSLFATDLAQSHNTVSTNLANKGYEKQYPDMAPADAKLRGITEEFDKKSAELSALAETGSDKTRRIAETQIKQYQDMKKLYSDIALGGPAATAAKNALEARQAGLKLTTASLEHRLSLTNQLTSAISNLGNAGMRIVDPAYYQSILDPLVRDTQNFTMGIGPSPLSTLDYTNKDGQVAGKFIFSSQNPVNDPLRTSDEVIASNNINMKNNLNMLRQTEDPVKFMQAMDVWTQTVVQEAVTSGEPLSTRYSPEVVAGVNRFLSDAFSNARTSGKLSYDKAGNSFLVLNTDGTQNAERSKRVNTMFKAFLSFNGRKTDEKIDEAGDLLQRLSDVRPATEALTEKSKGPVKPGELTEEQLKILGIDLPLKIQSRADLDRAFAAKRITKQEYDAILNDMPGWR